MSMKTKLWKNCKITSKWKKKIVLNKYNNILLLLMFYVIFESNQISFTLYPAHSKVGRGNLVLRHSVQPLSTNSGSIACWEAKINATLCFATPERKNENINLNKYFNSSYMVIALTASRFYSNTLCSCATTNPNI